MNKEQLLNILLPFPKKAPLQPKIISSDDFWDYMRQKVEFCSEEDDIIPAYVLIPKWISWKIPAVYCHHQHASQYHLWKSEIAWIQWNKDQALGLELVKRGYLVLAPDAIAFEERQNFNWWHYFELAKRIIKWENLLAKCIHDIHVWLNYLESIEVVDNNKIWFIGHSYWWRMALVMPAFDDRIKVSVSNCWCVNYKDSIEKNIWIQLDFCVPHITKIWDIEDIIKLWNQSHILISGTSDDKYTTWIEFLSEK